MVGSRCSRALQKEAQTQASLSLSLSCLLTLQKKQPRHLGQCIFFGFGMSSPKTQLQGSHYEAHSGSARMTTVRAVQNKLSPETNTKAITQEGGYSSCLPTLFIINTLASQKLSTTRMNRASFTAEQLFRLHDFILNVLMVLLQVSLKKNPLPTFREYSHQVHSKRRLIQPNGNVL